MPEWVIQSICTARKFLFLFHGGLVALYHRHFLQTFSSYSVITENIHAPLSLELKRMVEASQDF